MTPRDVDEIVGSLESSIELLTDAIYDVLRSTSSATDDEKRLLLDEEKRLSRARRSLEKARNLLIEHP